MGIKRAEHPNPQFERENWTNLNGLWEFEIDKSASGEDRKLFEAEKLEGTIVVPFCPESKLSGVGETDFLNSVWYKRNITIPDKEKRIILHIGACDYFTTVYINETKVGTHKGGYTSFAFDITDFVNVGENTLVIHALDDNRSYLQPRGKQSTKYRSHSCDYTRTTGIWQTVWLEYLPETHINSVKYYPDAANGRLTVHAYLSGYNTLNAKVFYENHEVGSTEVHVLSDSAVLTIDLAETHLWEPGHGRLYDIVFTYGEDKVSVPKTWEEFSDVAADIMRQNMQVGLSYTSLSGPEMMSSGIATMSLLPTLLLQYDVPLYNEEKTACLLDDPKVIEVFTKLTDFYTKQGFPQSFDFYNQFRSGLMPLSIQSYVMYTTLDEMAPDIRGRWDIAPLPGVKKDDGTIDCTDAAFGSGAVIVKKSNHHDAAWELLKWWTSADIQARYSKEMENRLGATGRQPVANVEALSRLSWKASTLKIIELQGQYVGEYPELPGGYYMSRAIDQSFWNVLSSGKRPKDMLYKWNAIANREISRKAEEY